NDDIADAGHGHVLTVGYHADRIGRVGAVDLQRIRAAKTVDDQFIKVRLGPSDGHHGSQTAHRRRGGAARDADMVVAGSGVDHHYVSSAIARATPCLCRQVDGNLLHVGPRQIVDDDLVGAAQRVELDPLDPVQVHGDIGDIAGEQHPRAVRGNIDVLVDVGAVEQQRIDAALAFDDVAAVARIPD